MESGRHSFSLEDEFKMTDLVLCTVRIVRPSNLIQLSVTYSSEVRERFPVLSLWVVRDVSRVRVLNTVTDQEKTSGSVSRRTRPLDPCFTV